jgi:hypothetical protein
MTIAASISTASSINDAGMSLRSWRRNCRKPGIGLGFFDPEAFAEYVRCFSWENDPRLLRGFRACPTCDFEMDEADRKAGHKVACPLLVLWGAKSHTGTVYGDVLGVWRDYATEVTGGPIDCGHYVPEEARTRRSAGSCGTSAKAERYLAPPGPASWLLPPRRPRSPSSR